MSEYIKINENGLYMVLEVTEDRDVRLLHFSGKPYEEFEELSEQRRRYCRLLELQVTGQDQVDHRGVKYTGTMPGNRMKYTGIEDNKNYLGRKVVINLFDDILGLAAKVNFQFYNGIPVARTWTTIENKGSEEIGIEYISLR